MTNEIPRRIRIDLMTPAELAIRNAMLAVENAGGSPGLTAAINLLQAASDHVADFVDGVPFNKGGPMPHWWWRDLDPDESGDTPYEAMCDRAEELVPDLLHSSFSGPSKWAVFFTTSEDGDKDVELFDTLEEARAFCEAAKAGSGAA